MCIYCIRGARSSLRCPIVEAPIAVQVTEAHIYVHLYLLIMYCIILCIYRQVKKKLLIYT